MSSYLLAGVICILLSAFFSASEMSLSSANRIRMENLSEDGSKRAGVVVRILDRFDDALSAILIGNNFVNIALSAIGSVIAIRYFGEQYTALSSVIVTVLVIVFGETAPKILAKKNANRLSLAVAPAVRVLTWVFYPLIFVVVHLVHAITGPLSGDESPDEQEAAVEELQSIIETAEDEDVIDEDRSELLQAALDFNEVAASEVMTARVDMVAIDIDDDWNEIMDTVTNSGYSRIPVYEDSIDNVIGVLYLNRFFKALLESETVDIRSILMTPCFVYKTLKLPAVLEKLRKEKTHLAIVTDEYGGTLGLISMEDVLEQIVGEIWDETDEVEEPVVERSEGVWELDGDMSIGEFTELMELSEDSFETESSTLGGWTIESFGGFPREGDSFTREDLKVTVLKMDGLRVERVLVERQKPETEKE